MSATFPGQRKGDRSAAIIGHSMDFTRFSAGERPIVPRTPLFELALSVGLT